MRFFLTIQIAIGYSGDGTNSHSHEWIGSYPDSAGFFVMSSMIHHFPIPSSNGHSALVQSLSSDSVENLSPKFTSFDVPRVAFSPFCIGASMVTIGCGIDPMSGEPYWTRNGMFVHCHAENLISNVKESSTM